MKATCEVIVAAVGLVFASIVWTVCAVLALFLTIIRGLGLIGVAIVVTLVLTLL